MKKVVIVGTGNLSYSVAELLNPLEMKLVGIGDTREESWNVFQENGDIKDVIEELPVAPVEMTPSLEPDLIVIAAGDEQTCADMRYVVIKSGFDGDILFMRDVLEQFSVRSAALRRTAHRLNSLGVPGAVAELGVWRGDTSWQLNVLFPGRTLYLFDTFAGFDARDIEKETELGCSDAKTGEYAYAKAEELLARLPHSGDVVLKEGWFPETALDLEEERFAFVCLDACLYQPTLTGLEFFFPRMSRGGVIMLCGYGDAKYGGVQKAVADLEEKFGALLMLPQGDLAGTMLIVHP